MRRRFPSGEESEGGGGRRIRLTVEAAPGKEVGRGRGSGRGSESERESRRERERERERGIRKETTLI